MSETIRSQQNEIFSSTLSIRECRTKAARGQLEVDDGLLGVTFGKQFDELPFKAEHADDKKNLPPHHRDPFDRGLIAQARREGM